MKGGAHPSLFAAVFYHDLKKKYPFAARLPEIIFLSSDGEAIFFPKIIICLVWPSFYFECSFSNGFRYYKVLYVSFFTAKKIFNLFSSSLINV